MNVYQQTSFIVALITAFLRVSPEEMSQIVYFTVHPASFSRDAQDFGGKRKATRGVP